MKTTKIITLLLICFFYTMHAAEDLSNSIYLGSRESDPASLIENVSTIHGDYSDYEIDVIVPGPDSLVLSRFYSSRDSFLTKTSLGGWRFNPHCFLYVEKEAHPRTYTTVEGTFDYARILIGIDEGSILSFVGWQNTLNPNIRSSFKLDGKGFSGVANTARGNMNAWTNLKNNQLHFGANRFEIYLSSGGKRLYAPSPSTPNLYLLEVEALPSGNQIFYEYKEDSVCEIKMTNASAEKIFSWIKIQYGPTIHVETSDGKTVDYHFQQDLLCEVIRSHKPSVEYEYLIVDDHPLLIKKELPEGRFVQIDYYPDGENKNKVEVVTTPTGSDGMASTRFSYSMEDDGSGFTEVNGPLTRKAIYRFDDQFQLTAIEQHLNGELYRIHKKIWGKKKNAGNLIATSVEDRNGAVYYFKSFVYDDKNNILEEKEYGNLTGAHTKSLVLDEEGVPQSDQEFHSKKYSYRTTKDFDIVSQKDEKGSSIKLCYKKGTSILVKKFILDGNIIIKRWFYNYNKDGALVQVIVDDRDEEYFEPGEYVYERYITKITPKQELPNVGAPEIIEEKYLDKNDGKKNVLKRTVNGFDSEGNIQTIAIYDNKGKYRYTKTLVYEQGILRSETDPLGNKMSYAYDGNQNLISETRSNSSFEYRYDLKNRLIYVGEKDRKGNCLETSYAYDAAGNITSELDRYGNKIIYTSDDLGRIISKTYPAVHTDEHRFDNPIYTYDYDLFDHIIRITNPEREVTEKTYTVRGTPTRILYPDGTQELFKYDPEGSLHRYLGKDGIVKVFEYDYQGRLAHIEYYERGSTGQEEGFKREYFEYDAFHLISHEDGKRCQTKYFYDGAGRLIAQTKGNQKIEFSYDSLGRSHAVKKWKDSKSFTFEVKEHNLLDQIIEERIEDSQGKILLKTRRIYNDAGYLQKIIGYPQNEESTLFNYDYDGFGRLIEIKDALGSTTKFNYQDDFVDEWGRKVLKRTQTDPYGVKTEEIFDPTGRVAKTMKRDHKDELLAESTFSFDLIGNITLEKNRIISNGKPLRDYNIRTSYSRGKQQSSTIAAGTAGEKTISWEYDPYGNLLTIQKPEIQPITYQYDNEGQISSISHKGGNKLFYDCKGNLERVELGKTLSVAYNIDSNDQLISETVKDPYGLYQVKLSYDGEGCIETIQLPDGSLIKYTYEGPFVKSISRQSKEKNELYNHRVIARDQMGHILEEVLIGHAGTRKFTWDKAGRRTGIFTDFFSDQTEYDLCHNMKKRIITLDGRIQEVEYGYSALNELISEEGRRYHYDSLGNRLEKDNFSYKINDLNQIVEAEGETFTFDAAGNLTTRTVGDKTWDFQTDPLGHLIFIQDSDQTALAFTYDLEGKRLSKRVGAKDKKAKTSRYFYLGQTELGCLDEKGDIVELKIPSNPNDPEANPCIAIEIKREIYAPLYDLQGNIACLIDPEQREIEESYTYSAFGNEKIINQRGKTILNSALNNPWRYKGKRVDLETGLVYFGKRYYDPRIGRWTSPDPMGNIDGPNLYQFCQNNPLTFTDYFGLASEKKSDEFTNYFYGEYEPRCHCEHHRDCKRGGDIGNILGGISTGITNFGMKAAEFYLQTPLAFSLVPGLEATYENMVLSPLNSFHAMVDKGLEYVLDFNSLDERTLRYKNATEIGVIALDIYMGNIKNIRKSFSFFQKAGKGKIQTAVRSRVQLPNGDISETLVDLSPTIERIQKDIKFPHRNDGAVFKNREGLLPKKNGMYYREYVHPTPGIEGPGPQRIIVGENGELFYSPDHYQTFIQIK